jgi:type VI protein secretion system component VasK
MNTAEAVAEALTAAFSLEDERFEVAGVPLGFDAYFTLAEAAALRESLDGLEDRMAVYVLQDLVDLRDGLKRGGLPAACEEMAARIERDIKPMEASRRRAWCEYIRALRRYVEAGK